LNRASVIGLGIVAVAGGLAIGTIAAIAGPASPHPSPSTPAVALGSPPSSSTSSSSSLGPSASGGGSTAPSPSGSLAPSATPNPTPVLVADPLTGDMVPQAVANRHPIAVMIDDLSAARPQSGFNSASIVWQAPAEGGIPRYMMIFQEKIPTDVGPVRSSRQYYILWASELHALYIHAGGSPQALATLRAQGNGKLVFNADEFRWGPYFRRITTRFAPHNLYTTGKQLRQLAARTGAKDGSFKWPWIFQADAPMAQRPVGGSVQVTYRGNNVIRYTYDRNTNSYFRSVTGEKQQVDASTKQRVHPKNVIVMVMRFGPLNDRETYKHRLEANQIGSGRAWVSTNGVTIPATWKKTSNTSPTQFFDSHGNVIPLTVGQTFVQVMKTTDLWTFVKGKPAPASSPSVAPSPSPSAAY
jgi:hypothetical protein